MLSVKSFFKKRLLPAKDPICLAPWVHAYMRINGERKLCCNSSHVNPKRNEPLAEFWNSRYMRSIRKKMLKGEVPQECLNCVRTIQSNKKYNQKFSDYKESLLTKTSITGKLYAEPISFDYRTSNLCNFKCRMCSSFSSSKAEAEELEFDGEYSLEDWQRGTNRTVLKQFHKEHTEKELFESIENYKIKDIYWAGGEPILLDLHWRTMEKILELKLENEVAISYSTNMSSLVFRDKHLFKNMLEKFASFSVTASLDATGEIGEYIRTGFIWENWLQNYQEAISYADQNRKVVQIALCLTIPSIIDLKNILLLSEKFQSNILTNYFSLGTDFKHPLSPLTLPIEHLKKLVSEALIECESLRHPRNETVFQALNSYLTLKENEPSSITLEEKRFDFRKFLQLEDRRKCSTSLKKILEKKDYLSEWYAEMVK